MKSHQVKNGKIVKSKIINKWNNGYKKVYNLKAKNGYNLKCTDDHKVLCENKFYELKDITNDISTRQFVRRRVVLFKKGSAQVLQQYNILFINMLQRIFPDT